MNIVNRPDTEMDSYDSIDFAMEMAVLRHVLFSSQGVKWDQSQSAIRKALTDFVRYEPSLLVERDQSSEELTSEGCSNGSDQESASEEIENDDYSVSD